MKQLALGLGLSLGLVILALLLLNWLQPGQQALREANDRIALDHTRKLEPLRYAVAQAGEVAKALAVTGLGLLMLAVGLIGLTVGLGALGNLRSIWRWGWLRSWLVKPTQNALYATLAEPDGQGHIRLQKPINDHLAQPIAALTNGRVDRLGGAGPVVRQLTNPQVEGHPFGEPAPAEYTPEQVIAPDPQNRPDTLVVGQKGSGKTNTLRYLIDAYRRAIPDAEFLVLSPVASNWAGLLPVVSETEDIRQAVLKLREELNWRDQALSAAGVRDVHRAAEAPRRVVLVVDEAETVADEIKLQSRANYTEFTGTLRIVVNTARNFGFCIIFGTQTARADVLDPAFMRNASTLLMMRMDAATAARFNQYDKRVIAELPTLQPGRAYCPQAGGYVQFPLVETIRKPRISTIYAPSAQLPAGSAGAASYPLQLPADATADGLGPADAPDGVTASGTGSGTVPLQAVFQAAPPPFSGTGSGTVPLERRVARIPKDRVPRDPVDQEALYQLWQSVGRNASEVERQVYGYDGGIAHYYAAYGINRALARRQQPPAYKEKGA